MKSLLDSQKKLILIYGQEIYTTAPPAKVLDLRRSLIAEEHKEFVEAMAKLLWSDEFGINLDQDRAHLLKEFSDLIVVLFGTMAQLGFTADQLEDAFDIVNLDNHAKVYLHKSSAEVAQEHYQSQGLDCSIHEEVFENTIYYTVRNLSGKTLKRYPRPDESAEERILKYVLKS